MNNEFERRGCGIKLIEELKNAQWKRFRNSARHNENEMFKNC